MLFKSRVETQKEAMKILQINGVYPIKSTGRIVKEIEVVHNKNNIDSYVAACECTVNKPNVHTMGSTWYVKANILKTRLFGKHGFYNKSATRRLLRWIDEIKPDIIHLHNIHGHYVNVKLLFEFIKKHDISVVWTLHDCWAFTGHCSHFDYVGCNKWQKGCYSCPMKKSYPGSWFFDRSRGNYSAKKALFTGVTKMHIVTPSQWLKDLCQKSFLGKYPVTVIHNGIDTDVFSPTASDLRKELGIEDKFVIMGIVNKFSGYKGGEYFLKLSRMLSDDEVILLVSLEEKPEDIPENIIALPRTADDKRLAAIYSAADVFVNPTLQDTFSMVNIEALSCGTPVVTFNSGGSSEMISEKCGVSVNRGNIKALFDSIQKVKDGAFSADDCRAQALMFKTEDCFSKYLDIYKSVSDM